VLHLSRCAFVSRVNQVLASSLWACFWTFAILKFTAKFTPIRVSDHGEIIGLDLDCHGEM
jgi:ammonia channel protein AmtB